LNCGRCGNVCPDPIEGEVVACVSATCIYDCAAGAFDCNGACTYLDSDRNNCGACGNVCPASAPNCSNGVCSNCPPGLTQCGDSCVDLWFDDANCGACGAICNGGEYCTFGACYCDPNGPYFCP
jgi:hypothetical protein